MSFRCPKCHASTTLWEDCEVPAWRAVDENLSPLQGGFPNPEREAFWDDAVGFATYGCGECSWQGSLAQLEEIGLDGEPLPDIHRDQISIEEALFDE